MSLQDLENNLRPNNKEIGLTIRYQVAMITPQTKQTPKIFIVRLSFEPVGKDARRSNTSGTRMPTTGQRLTRQI